MPNIVVDPDEEFFCEPAVQAFAAVSAGDVGSLPHGDLLVARASHDPVKRITTIRFELGPGAAWHIAIAIMRARGLPLQGLDAPAALPAPVVLDGAGI